ncbi:MAG TPA: hypothetical protein VGR69_03875 [Candidatus Rubrimentiphilum sp.]|nr:hypothetical protein [Candidatus Rubrimentiphilum sp.]
MQAVVRRFGLYAATVMLPLIFCAATTSAQLADVMKRLQSNPAAPAQYTANVQVKMHMRGFPWITKTVSGTELYKHPGLYHFAFRDAPKALDQLSSLEDDLADPAGWPQRYDVSLVTPPSPGVDPVVRLMPKVHKLVRSIDITVNMAKGHIDKAVWTRFDGGTITMTQKYNIVDSREVVSEQDASVRIPMMSADVTATYSNFEVDAGSGTH